MKLRDEFPSLDEFCAYYGVERAEVEVALWGAGFEYSAENNKFWEKSGTAEWAWAYVMI